MDDASTHQIRPLVVAVGGRVTGHLEGNFDPEVWNAGAEKSSMWTICTSVPKLTQVGEESILRRSREPWLRN